MTISPSIWPRTMFACALMALLVSLGCWQLDRAEQKRALRTAFDVQVEAPALDLALHGVEPVTNHAWRAVTAAGRYEPPVLLLDNRVRDGRIGYENPDGLPASTTAPASSSTRLADGRCHAH